MCGGDLKLSPPGPWWWIIQQASWFLVETTCLKHLDTNKTHYSFQEASMYKLRTLGDGWWGDLYYYQDRVFRIRWPIVCCGGTMGSATGCSEYDGPLFVVVARWDLLGSAIMTDSWGLSLANLWDQPRDCWLEDSKLISHCFLCGTDKPSIVSFGDNNLLTRRDFSILDILKK